jgi:hypothetical protein
VSVQVVPVRHAETCAEPGATDRRPRQRLNSTSAVDIRAIDAPRRPRRQAVLIESLPYLPASLVIVRWP